MVLPGVIYLLWVFYCLSRIVLYLCNLHNYILLIQVSDFQVPVSQMGTFLFVLYYLIAYTCNSNFNFNTINLFNNLLVDCLKPHLSLGGVFFSLRFGCYYYNAYNCSLINTCMAKKKRVWIDYNLNKDKANPETWHKVLVMLSLKLGIATEAEIAEVNKYVLKSHYDKGDSIILTLNTLFQREGNPTRPCEKK